MSSRKHRLRSQHADWLTLVEPVGAFLTVPVLEATFPNGLDTADAAIRSDVRTRLEDLGTDAAVRTAWVRWLLADLAGYGQHLVDGSAAGDQLTHPVAEHGVTLRPDLVVRNPDGTARLLITTWPLRTPLPG